MRAIATVYRQSSVVCVSVCLFVCVGHTGESCKNGRTDSDVVWGQTCVGPGNHVLDRNARWRHLANMIDRSVRSNDAACRHHCLSIVHVLPAGLLRCWLGDRRAFTDVNFPKVLFQNRQKKETEDNR